MLQFILMDLIMIAFGTMLYLIVRALPRLEVGEATQDSKGIFERWITSEIPERFDTFVNNFLLKFLRKLKVFLLKIDNLLHKRLTHMKALQEEGDKIDFKDVIGDDLAKGESKGDN